MLEHLQMSEAFEICLSLKHVDICRYSSIQIRDSKFLKKPIKYKSSGRGRKGICLALLGPSIFEGNVVQNGVSLVGR